MARGGGAAAPLRWDGTAAAALPPIDAHQPPPRDPSSTSRSTRPRRTRAGPGSACRPSPSGRRRRRRLPASSSTRREPSGSGRRRPSRAYPGFAAFPYAEYSEPFFGDEYRVLRGGSWRHRPAASPGPRSATGISRSGGRSSPACAAPAMARGPPPTAQRSGSTSWLGAMPRGRPRSGVQPGPRAPPRPCLARNAPETVPMSHQASSGLPALGGVRVDVLLDEAGVRCTRRRPAACEPARRSCPRSGSTTSAARDCTRRSRGCPGTTSPARGRDPGAPRRRSRARTQARTLVELGAGTAKNVRLLLDALDPPARSSASCRSTSARRPCGRARSDRRRVPPGVRARDRRRLRARSRRAPRRRAPADRLPRQHDGNLYPGPHEPARPCTRPSTPSRRAHPRTDNRGCTPPGSSSCRARSSASPRTSQHPRWR